MDSMLRFRSLMVWLFFIKLMDQVVDPLGIDFLNKILFVPGEISFFRSAVLFDKRVLLLLLTDLRSLLLCHLATEFRIKCVLNKVLVLNIGLVD